MLIALGVFDADIIPASFNVPIQMNQLYDLVVTALCLGFKQVSLDLENHEFSATGELGTITKLHHNDIGKAIRYEGDTGALLPQFGERYLSPLVLFVNGLCPMP